MQGSWNHTRSSFLGENWHVVAWLCGGRTLPRLAALPWCVWIRPSEWFEERGVSSGLIFSSPHRSATSPRRRASLPCNSATTARRQASSSRVISVATTRCGGSRHRPSMSKRAVSSRRRRGSIYLTAWTIWCRWVTCVALQPSVTSRAISCL